MFLTYNKKNKVSFSVRVKFLFLLFFLISSIAKAKEVSFLTEDGCKISAYENIYSTKSPILLEAHGLGSNKDEWNKFNSFLEKEKINYLAIDLRGHGKSKICGKKEIDYKNFSKKDWEKIVLDWKAAADYLLKKFPPRLIIPVGASIAANAAAIFSANKNFSGIILLSPGYDYAGLKPANAIKENHSTILFVYADSDYYCAKSCLYFSRICSEKHLNCHFLNAKDGHGVQIFDSPQGSAYALEVIRFIKKLQ